jgi:hypothetical protein
MTALSGRPPAAGVRYVFVLVAQDDMGASYEVTVQTAVRTARTRLRIDAVEARLDGDATELDPTWVTQLLALAKTIARHREGAPWPRRVERWRAPGVR